MFFRLDLLLKLNLVGEVVPRALNSLYVGLCYALPFNLGAVVS